MRIAVLGATGYTGLELVRLLSQHPEMELTCLTSDSQAGVPFPDVYPHASGIVPHVLEPVDADHVAEIADIAMLGLPSGLSTAIVPELLARGLRVIDLAGDHRLPAEEYGTWYKKTPPSDDVLDQAVYGLPELYAPQIATAQLIANPGCYPTATLLSLVPLLRHGLIDPASLIVDAKSGVTGAGKALNPGIHFAEVNENFKAYKVGAHQHIPEIERILTRENGGEQVTISFTTHLVPMNRGILTTSYAQLTEARSSADLLDLYADFYRDAPFVRIHPPGRFPQTRDVSASNYCDIGLYADPRTGRVTVLAAIDNLVKGAAGQAIQNLNILAGLEQTTGLTSMPVYL
jgi:N-acetyl-gamma-glutamyl-phosphate reductase